MKNTIALNEDVQTPDSELFQNTLEFAKKLDKEDPLKEFRSRFFIPQHKNKDTVYFNGNSLGLQPKSVSHYIQAELDEWARLGVMGHHVAKQPWITYHEQFSEPVAKIVGALPHEVIVMNQLTVNLHLLMTSFYRPTTQRFKIICEAKAFPSDQYAIQSQVILHGLDPKDAIIE